MNKLTIPAILVATVLVAGIFAFMPVQQASTVHDTIIATLGGSATPITNDAISALLTPEVADILADTAAMEPQITVARMAELDGANLPADVDLILADTAAMEPQITAARMQELDPGNLPLDMTNLDTNIESTQTQIFALVQTGSATMAAGVTQAVLTVANTGIMYITVDTTADGGTGTKIQVAGVDVCTDITIIGTDSPFTCATPVTITQAVTFVDADGGNDSAGTVVAVVIASVTNPE